MRFLFLFLFMPMLLCAQSVAFEVAYSGYSSPVDISDPEDGTDRLFITEQEGRIKIIENGIKLSTPFLDIETKVRSDGERGLLGLVFHPDYENNGFFFVNYTATINGSLTSIIARYNVSTTDANIADPASEKILITFSQPYTNHNAGDLNFSPLDGYLYIATGDGGSGNDPGCRAQDTTSYHGKILRIDVDQNVGTPPHYGIPAGNLKDEIWGLGLRNPWRVSFDRANGDYWIADVGQGAHEEINRISANTMEGVNFGWKVKEAEDCTNSGSSGCNGIDPPACNSNTYTDPVYFMSRNDAKSITGGYVYRGCKYPALVGKYICADFITGNGFMINSENNLTTPLGQVASNISTFGEDHKGELWAASLSGQIYRVVDLSVQKTLTLDSGDFPLSGAYKATEKIVISEPLNQTLSGVTFITDRVELAENVTIPEGNELVVSDDFCQE